MIRIPLAIIIALSFIFINLKSAKSQDRTSEIYFVFSSSSDLKSILETEDVKTIQFKIEGIKDDATADELLAGFLAFKEKVTSFTIEAAKAERTRNAEMTLSPEVHTAAFTKFLITNEIIKIRIDNRIMNTVDLNDHDQ
jgi:hypothetical protein